MINFNALPETQKLALFAFGEPDRIGTESNLLIAAAMADKPHISSLLSVLVDLLESDEMTDDDFTQLYWNIRSEINARMSRYEEAHLKITGELCEEYAWKGMAKLRFLGYFGHEQAKFTMKRLAFVERAMPDPELQRVVHELVSEIGIMIVFNPEDYPRVLRKSRRFLEYADGEKAEAKAKANA